MRIAVLLPCFNEEHAISRVVEGFSKALPEAVIYVYDNNSTDRTVELARAAGAIVRTEPHQGKGHVVRRMFADVEADIYVMADGDGTYPPEAAPILVDELTSKAVDMVIGARKDIVHDAGRKGHAFGNRLFNTLFRWLFSDEFADIFSGYRVFSRRFVKSFPAMSHRFETETEMSVHAARLSIPVSEVEIDYGIRDEGSHSKLNSVRDGSRILKSMFVLLKETRPLLFFGVIGFVFEFTAVILSVPLVVTYLDIGLVPRLPTAVAVVGLVSVGGMAWTAALILDSVSRSRIEQKRLAFLAANK